LNQQFTRSEVERMTGATHRQLDYWSRLGLVRPRARWGERFFTFTDLVAVETLNRLAARHIPARRLLRALDTLDRQLGQARAPLSSLRVSVHGTRIVVHEPGPAGRPIEPLSGQFVLDFETAPLEQKVHALGQRTAEEWFEMGMAQDANPETLDSATDAYRQAIAAAPDWVEAHINLGTTLFQLGRWEESREAFAQAIATDPASALAHFNLGCVCDRLGEVETSIKEFRASIGLIPEMADAHLNLALGYEKTGRKSEAARHFSLYLRHEPNGPWADFVRGKLQPARRSSPGKVTPFRQARS
jgi:tetratricopeptide (TPR) repeat protein